MIGGPRIRPSAAVRVMVAGLTVITVSACGGTRSSALPTAPASSVPVASPPPDRASSPLCPLSGNVLELPRRSLTGVTLAPENAVLDGVVFTLGGPPAPGARLEVSVAAPPFSRGGQALDVEGDRVLELRFTGVETHDPSGAAAFQGPRDLEPDRPAIRRLTVFDEVDGLVAWYLGLAGSGCVTFGVRDDDGVLLLATHDR